MNGRIICGVCIAVCPAYEAVSGPGLTIKDRQINKCRIVAFRSAKGDTIFAPILTSLIQL